MALRSGTRLGPYEILAPLGAGGMGEVYRARDTRLGRDVAVKVLPQHTAASPENRARFRREAKTISSLNHPHICVLHDIGQEGDTDFLVMEMVEGETLARRLARGPLQPAEVLRIGAQITDALDRAHRAGVIHRDLKPGNVMLTRVGAKLMDFGLARVAGGPAGRDADATAAEPVGPLSDEEPITERGTVVGTYQYMAPEQLEGKAPDARSDIWALGCVLYEMATGKRAFEGATPASVISAIMRDQPRDMAELAPLMPAALDLLVKACLAKDPDDRIQSAHDACLQIAWISSPGLGGEVADRHVARERVMWALAVVVVSLLAILLAPKRPAPKPVVLEVTTPPQVISIDLPCVSPDGTTLAFNATESTGRSSVWVRRLSSHQPRRLPGTEGASRPFWSPDSRKLAYFAGGKLVKIDISGGPPVELCDAPQGGDGSWSERGVILFDGAADSVQMVPAAGGTPTGATRRMGNLASSSSWPHFLPDGKHFLYVAYSPGTDSGSIMVGSIASQKTARVGAVESRVQFASGHLFYMSGSVLTARPFDPTSFKFTGEPVAIAENVRTDTAGGADFSVSREGTLIYHSDPLAAGERLVWLDRRGDQVGIVGQRGYYGGPALSPKETKLAVNVTDLRRRNSAIWIWDLGRNLGTRLTMTPLVTFAPVWSPDGRSVVYGRERDGAFDLFVHPVGAALGESLLYASRELKEANGWSADGRWILFTSTALDSRTDDMNLYALSVTNPERRSPIAESRFREVGCSLSPDGRWVAYVSKESGEREVYVQRFLGDGDRWRISTGGGVQPSWRGDSREIFFISADGALVSVAVQQGSTPRFSSPKRLFRIPGTIRFDTRNQYVPAHDGSRFLFVAPEDETTAGATTVVLNWPALLANEGD